MNTLVHGRQAGRPVFRHEDYDAFGWAPGAGIFAKRRPWLLTMIGHDLNNLLGSPGAAHITERSRVPEGFKYVQARIISLVGDGETSALSAVRAIVQLRFSLPVEGIYPQVAADENGELAFYWLAGQSRLEIVVPEKGEIYVRATGLSHDLNLEGFFDPLPAKRIRAIISELTKVVEKVNPDWRQIFEAP